MKLETKIKFLNRVGESLEKRLKHLGIETIQDLLFYYPFRYEDYSQVAKIVNLVEGEQVSVKGKIELISNKRSPRKRKIITEAIVADETGQIRIVWFGQPFITKSLKVGDEVFFSGVVKSDMFGIQLLGPAYEKVNKNTVHTARIVPMYHLTTGITQKQLRSILKQCIGSTDQIKDWLPEQILEELDLPPLAQSIKSIHFPENEEELKQAERRIKFDELFLLQLRAEMIRQSIKHYNAPKIKFKEEETKSFVESLPFELTKDQKVVAWEILQDLEKNEPMNRLIEGDVGSGKTVVAALVINNVAINGFQSVIMAPTEILAKQHFESLSNVFARNDFKVGLLTGSQAIISRDKMEIDGDKLSQSISTYLNLSKKDFLKEINFGELQIVVGTHALLSEKVGFKNLALVVVDEQHRFGVEQRKILREKSGDPKTIPHFLSMTATPIPRSFALTLYGDLDLSIIKTKPKDRKEIKTRLVEPHNRERAYDFIRGQVKQGRQVFVICPLISQKEKVKSKKNEIEDTFNFHTGDDKKSVMSEYEKLSKNIFPDLEVGYLHGKMKPKEKDEQMQKFASGEIDILVSTSVVEVGVDIPNASVMMIEGAERFGLAQLHQFRGRVGRSEYQSYCFLFTDSDSRDVAERLKFFEENTDGFKIAEYDLERRGPGEVYGKVQSGMMNLRKASMKDVELIKLARDTAREINFEKYLELKEKVREWESGVHLE